MSSAVLKVEDTTIHAVGVRGMDSQEDQDYLDGVNADTRECCRATMRSFGRWKWQGTGC